MKTAVDDAKLQPQTMMIHKYVEDWLKEAEDALNDAQSLEGRVEENKRCLRWCPNWSWRYQLSKKMEKNSVAITKLLEKSSKFEKAEGVGRRAPLSVIEFFQPPEGYVPSKSSTYAFNEIMEALKSDEVKMIEVWGMRGAGKTTLVKVVGNQVDKDKLFDRVINVVVSQTPVIENIQDTIADFIDLTFEKTTTYSRKSRGIMVEIAKRKKGAYNP